MKKLNEPVLQIGDIILTTTSNKSSKGIRKVTKSDISHALIYVESHSVIDATPDGVHSKNTQRLFWEDECAVHVLRLAEGLDASQLRRITNYARSQIGTRYSKTEAVRSVLGGAKSPGRQQFCSRLVARAYSNAGLNLVDNVDYCTPQQLKDSTKLIAVQNAVRNAHNEEISSREDVFNTPNEMTKATNALLSGARAKNARIENLNDIDQYLRTNPDDDAFFVNLYQQSGYLTIWVAERAKNIWQYDLQAMIEIQIPYEAKREYCEDLLGDDEEGLERYERNRARYSLLVEEYPLETFRLLKTLYEKLVELHLIRRQTAAEWLSCNGSDVFPARDPVVLLTPHTPEWFAALAVLNPQQAAHTRTVLQQSESNSVCSVCGDDPTSDYRLVGPGIPRGVLCTLRLCNDCWRIRSEMHAESLALFGE